MHHSVNPLVAVITGDIVMDWNFARAFQPAKGPAACSADGAVDICWQRGGASLLADLLGVVSSDLAGRGLSIDLRQPAVPQTSAGVIPGDPRFHHSFAIWTERKSSLTPPLDREKAWRVEELLGTRHADPAHAALPVENDTAGAGLVILQDSNLGFRHASDCWPLAITAPGSQPTWIVYSMSKPVATGELWEHVHREHAARTIVITTADDLRLTEVQISRELSWERTAQDIFWELTHNPCVNALSHCAHVIVSFGAAGAILLSRNPGEPLACSLFFDPRLIEGVWEKGFPGGVIGSCSCLVAGIARQLMIDPLKPDIGLGIQSALSAARTLHIIGYGQKGKPGILAFPFTEVAASLEKEEHALSVVSVQDPLRFYQQPASPEEKPLVPGFWTILQDRYRGALDRLAEDIVRRGSEATLKDVPLGQFGNLLTVDRQEIESFRSIRSLIGEYCQQAQQKRPLSIAVFGAPGSGKSFGIIEVASSLLPGQIEVREFNLSQFASPGDLISALHQVRNIGLGGKIPLIFWDEFDTSLGSMPLGWLRYFLAPMQDGRFQEGQISHPLGRCIFVFAGGTASSIAEFGRGLSESEFKAAKGPDYISRLKGFVNILGPNPVVAAGDPSLHDPFFIIRRAILLRSIFKRSCPALFEKDILQIDSGVLRALLRTRSYRHGVRSIESIIMMSRLAGERSFERSALPSEIQLDLHVDGQDFLALVQQLELSGPVLEDLAKAAHDLYREGVQARHAQTYAASLSYAELPEEYKEQNRQNVRDIPLKLASAGFVMIPARSNEPPFNFPGPALERLAEREHERWMHAKLAAGWKHGPQTDEARKLNQCLVPWQELPEPEKEKDRDLVRAIPCMLARAGYAIVEARA